MVLQTVPAAPGGHAKLYMGGGFLQCCFSTGAQSPLSQEGFDKASPPGPAGTVELQGAGSLPTTGLDSV